MRLKTVKWCSSKVNIPGVAFKDYESETAFQIYCADWLRKQYSILHDDRFRFWHHSANERHGGHAGMMAKMMGQSKGFPDFVNIGLKLAIEFKVEGRKLSLRQSEWFEYLERLGWQCELVYTFDRFRELVLSRTAKHN